MNAGKQEKKQQIKAATQAFHAKKKHATVTINLDFTKHHLGWRLKEGHFGHEQRIIEEMMHASMGGTQYEKAIHQPYPNGSPAPKLGIYIRFPSGSGGVTTGHTEPELMQDVDW